jgi:hypothetical protein
MVGLVADRVFRWHDSAELPICDWTIVSFASGQRDGEKAAFSTREFVYRRIARIARNRLVRRGGWLHWPVQKKRT